VPEPGEHPARPLTGFSRSFDMQDLLYVVITIVVFAVLFLLVKGIEHIES
jgi:hypothetical protein